MRTIWTGRALSPLKSVRTYIASDKSDAATVLLRRLFEATDRLATSPQMGRAGRIPGIRELSIPNRPYLIVYGVTDTTFEVLALFHGARCWPKYLPN